MIAVERSALASSHPLYLAFVLIAKTNCTYYYNILASEAEFSELTALIIIEYDRIILIGDFQH